MIEVVRVLGVLGWAVVLGACGSVAPHGGAGTDAAGPEIDASTDAPAPRCDPAAAFGTPVAVSSIHVAADDEYGRLSPDELTMYFSSNRAGSGGYDIFQATRGSLSMPFGDVVPVAGVNTAGDDRVPSVTTDGHTMVALSQATPSSLRRVTIATRMNTTVAFGALQVIAVLNGTTNDSDPYMLPSGNVVYFTSDRGGNYSMYRSAKAGDAFGTATIVSGVDLDTPDIEATPVASPDELTLYFGSLRATGAGSFDIYQANRATLADGFRAPVPLTTLNTDQFEVPSWISADGCELYITRTGADGKNQIFVATRGR